MKSTTKELFLIVIASALLTGCASTPTTAWEYKTLNTRVFTTPTLAETLNELAEEGWSVVSSSSALGSGANTSNPYITVILKRPKQ